LFSVIFSWKLFQVDPGSEILIRPRPISGSKWK
jgi:hypothetical protein